MHQAWLKKEADPDGQQFYIKSKLFDTNYDSNPSKSWKRLGLQTVGASPEIETRHKVKGYLARKLFETSVIFLTTWNTAPFIYTHPRNPLHHIIQLSDIQLHMQEKHAQPNMYSFIPNHRIITA